MAVQVELIDIGALANDGTGDPLRVAFDKINNNFSTLSAISFPAPGGIEGSLQYKIGPSYTGSPNLFFDSSNNALKLNSNISVVSGGNVVIASRADPIHKLHLSNVGLDVGNVNIAETGNTITFSIVGSPGAKISLAGLNDIQVSGNIITSGNVALGNSLAYGNIIIGSAKVTTPDATLNQVIYQTPASTFTTGKFKIASSRNISTNYTQSVELNIVVTGDKGVLRYTAHSTVFSSLPVTKYNVDLHFSNVRIMVSPQFADPIVHLISYEINN
jgi:hypothetical protein